MNRITGKLLVSPLSIGKKRTWIPTFPTIKLGRKTLSWLVGAQSELEYNAVAVNIAFEVLVYGSLVTALLLTLRSLFSDTVVMYILFALLLLWFPSFFAGIGVSKLADLVIGSLIGWSYTKSKKWKAEIRRMDMEGKPKRQPVNWGAWDEEEED